MNYVLSISRRQLLVVLGAAPSMALADLYDDYINSTSKAPFVAFLGRKASVESIGHAFVGLGVQLNSDLRVYERLFGLYPKDGALAAVKSIFSKVSGKLDYSFEDISWHTELRRSIDDRQRASMLELFKEWSSDAPQYSLLQNGGINCSGFAALVAKEAGMSVPSGAGSTRPWKYIDALKEANP